MKRRRKKRGPYGLSGFAQGKGITKWDAVKEGGLLVLAAIASGGVGAAIGKHSLVVGIPLTMVGVCKSNKYLAAAGLGFCLANGFQKIGGTPINGFENEMDGFDMAQIKERVGNYFKNFSEKLYLPKSQTIVGGLDGDGDQPSYFLNPYSSLQGNELDLSQLDKVQENIAQMNAMGDIEREF